MDLNIFYIDAFVGDSCKGSTACIIPLDSWLSDELLLKISKRKSVPETAFVIIKKDKVLLRWFTPEIEMDLCGHATLAASHCLKTILNYEKDEIIFKTLSGDLSVKISDDLYKMDFPSRPPFKANLPELIKKSLNINPKEVLKSRDYVLVYEMESEIKKIKIDKFFFDQINLNTGGVIVTAKGDDCDFVSRFFTPQASILEDSVTGSAHCSLIPFWASRLKKKTLNARQVSKRGGELFCEDKGGRVIICGKAKTYSVGYLWTA